MLKEIVDYDAMDIRLVDEDASELVVHLLARRERRGDARLPHLDRRGRERLGRAPQRGAARQRHDHTTRASCRCRAPRKTSRRRRIIVPLNVRGKVTGVLCLDRLGGATFDEHELEPAKLFANLAAIAIQNARSYEEMERQAISDGLTGIHNYRHFHDTLKATVSRAERYARDVLPAHDGPRPLQDGQRHHRPPGGRRGPARRGATCCAAARASRTTWPATAARSSS